MGEKLKIPYWKFVCNDFNKVFCTETRLVHFLSSLSKPYGEVVFIKPDDFIKTRYQTNDYLNQFTEEVNDES